MAKKNHPFRRIPQKESGTYQFNGLFKVSKTVKHFLNTTEILWLYNDAKKSVLKNKGADHIFIFERMVNGKKERIVLVDELNREMITSGEYKSTDNYCTMMFDYEYF